MATEIEDLRARKDRLKDEFQTEEQKEKSLQEDIAILEEKIEIREIERKLEEKQKSVRQLESRKGELQNKWNQPVQDTKKDDEQKESSPEVMVSVEPVYNAEPNQSDESNTQKKRRFF